MPSSFSTSLPKLSGGAVKLPSVSRREGAAGAGAVDPEDIAIGVGVEHQALDAGDAPAGTEEVDALELVVGIGSGRIVDDHAGDARDRRVGLGLTGSEVHDDVERPGIEPALRDGLLDLGGDQVVVARLVV